MLGHSNISETMDTYSHVLPSMQETAVKALGDADATATAGDFGSATAVAIADADAVNVANAAGISIHTVNFSLNNW